MNSELGFLCHPQLTQEQPDAPCNFGCLDQQAGLKWVYRNISNFGGDPNNITIAGQSAGGSSVMYQMACPNNEGYFNKAVIMSGMFGSPYAVNELFQPKSLEQAGEKGQSLFNYLGVKNLEEARQLDPFFICKKYSELRNNGEMFFTVVKDGHFCIQDPMIAFQDGTRIRVPVMAGNTGDEFIDLIHATNKDDLKMKAREYFSTQADEFLSFPEARIRTDFGYSPVSSPELGTKKAFLAENSHKNSYYLQNYQSYLNRRRSL